MCEKSIIISKQRIAWLDIAKGFGIFFIVWGHVLRTGHFRTYLYAFNVALFFFLLGYTFKYGASLKEFFEETFFSDNDSVLHMGNRKYNNILVDGQIPFF